MPLGPGPPVRAITRYTSAAPPPLMNALLPCTRAQLRLQSACQSRLCNTRCNVLHSMHSQLWVGRVPAPRGCSVIQSPDSQPHTHHMLSQPAAEGISHDKMHKPACCSARRGRDCPMTLSVRGGKAYAKHVGGSIALGRGDQRCSITATVGFCEAVGCQFVHGHQLWQVAQPLLFCAVPA